MSKGNSTLIVIIVVAILAALGWWYWSQRVAHAPAPEATQSASGTPTVTTLPSGSAADNASLNADLNTIDGQMNGFNSDNASVNGSMSDQPVQQSSL